MIFHHSVSFDSFVQMFEYSIKEKNETVLLKKEKRKTLKKKKRKKPKSVTFNLN